MAGQCHQKASSGQRVAPSSRGRPGSSPSSAIGVVGGIDVPASSSCARRRVDVQYGQDREVRAALVPPTLSRAQRAHYRLSFAERLARNVWVSSASRPLITLFGVPETFSALLGLKAT
jgi:hypothetical protein